SSQRTSSSPTSILSACAGSTESCITYQCTDSGHHVAFACPVPLGRSSSSSSLSPPLPAGKGGRPRSYSEESLLLISLLRTLWRLSYQDMHDWLKSWPVACLWIKMDNLSL